MSESAYAFTSPNEKDNDGDTITPPPFLEEWENEFQDEVFDQKVILAASFPFTVAAFSEFLRKAQTAVHGDGKADVIWIDFRSLEFFPAMYSLIQIFWFSGIIFLFNSRRHRPFCVRNYNVLCVLTLLFARNAVGFVFQHSLHGITCQRGNRNGEVLLERGYLLLGDQYIILNLMALVWRLSPGCALICAFSSSMFALLAELAVRDPDYAMATGVLFHLIVGLYASYSCHLRELFAREHFALKKEIKFLSDQNASLLYTLIPPNVVERLSSHAEQHFLCGEIKQCTIMFCALERQSELAFARLNDIFSASSAQPDDEPDSDVGARPSRSAPATSSPASLGSLDGILSSFLVCWGRCGWGCGHADAALGGAVCGGGTADQTRKVSTRPFPLTGVGPHGSIPRVAGHSRPAAVAKAAVARMPPLAAAVQMRAARLIVSPYRQ